MAYRTVQPKWGEIMAPSENKHWHGFPTFIDAAKAMVWLVGILGAIGTAVIAYAVAQNDLRYAPIAVVAEVKANGVTARAVDTKVVVIQQQLLRAELSNVKERSCKAQNTDSKRFYTNELIRLVAELTVLSGGSAPFVPTCEDF